jgi:HK97 family phage major capsid protein
MPTANELRTTRAGILAKTRQMVSAAEEAKREFTEAEDGEFRRLMGEVDALAGQITAAERTEWLAAQEADQRGTAGRRTPATRPAVRQLDQAGADELVRSWALAGTPQYRPDADAVHRAAEAGFDVNSQVISYRALSKGTTTAGGHTVPQSFSTELERILAYYFLVGEAVDQFSTDDGTDYPWPTVTDVSNSAAQVAEEAAIGTTTDPTFGQIVYKSWDYFSPIVKVSYQLLRDSSRNIPALLAELFAERMGRKRDAAVVSTNAGTAAPEGMLNGVSVGVNLATGNPITFAKLLALESAVDLAYRNYPGTGFLMHDATWQAIRALVDSNGRPLLNMDIQNGVQRRLLGYPVFISNNMTAHTSPGDNQPLMLFGAVKKYKVRRVGGSTLTRLNELYAGTGQVGFCLHEAWDGRWITKNGVATLNSFDS